MNETPQNQEDFPSNDDERRWASEPDSPSQRIHQIRAKLENAANEYAERKLSRSQFNAIYAHYNEQRKIIEQITARDPKNDAWKQAARSGKTSFLRDHFEAHPVSYIVYVHHNKTPLIGGGIRPDLTRINQLLHVLWSMEKVRVGVARIAVKSPQWIVLVAGNYGVTFVTYHLEPSGAQGNYVRDLHNDFERANRLFLRRNKINTAQMVFPQRALLEQRR